MRNHTARLYAIAVALAVFFVSWAFVAARPWATEAAASAAADPRLAQLAKREDQLRELASSARRIVAARWAAYREALAERVQQNGAIRDANAQLAASAAQPQILTVPAAPVTTTRSS
jgi:hypothetical protein